MGLAETQCHATEGPQGKANGDTRFDPGHAAPFRPVLRFPVLKKYLGSLSNMQMLCGIRNKLLIEGLGDPTLRNTCHRSISALLHATCRKP